MLCSNYHFAWIGSACFQRMLPNGATPCRSPLLTLLTHVFLSLSSPFYCSVVPRGSPCLKLDQHGPIFYLLSSTQQSVAPPKNYPPPSVYPIPIPRHKGTD